MRALALIVTLMFGAGCGAALELPPGLDDATQLPVTGRATERFESAEIEFGPFVGYAISRGFQSGMAGRDFFGKGIDQLRDYPENDSFSYTLRGKSEWRAICTTAATQQGVAGVAAKNQLNCLCVNAASASSVEMQAASESDDLRGIITGAEKSYALHGSRDVEGSKIARKRASGYVISEKERPLGAIDVLGAGTVWLVPELSEAEQDIVACTAVALLLHH